MPDIFPTDVPLETVRAGLANTACILLIDAAQHVRRTTVIVEAATTMALQDSLTPVGQDAELVNYLNASQQAMTNALLTFNEMVSAAVGILKDDQGPRGGRRLALAAEGPISGGGKAVTSGG